MARGFGRTSTRRRKASGRAGVALVVYHAGTDVDQHVAALKRLRRFKITCVQQRALPTRGPARVVDAVLWELVPGKRPNKRHLAAIAHGSLLVSYSVDSDRQLSDVSRRTGFASHLKAPLSPLDVERELALVASTDLADRFATFQSTLRRHLTRQDVLADVFRNVNASVDPQRVADTLVMYASKWLPVPCWAVIAPDESATPKILASRGLTSNREACAEALGAWVIRRGEECSSANLQRDRRTPGGPAAAALAFPLVSRGRTVGALVGVDARPAERVPPLGSVLLDTVGSLIEPAAIALDNALRLQRAEALSLTDDLTGLYNSRFLSIVLRRETKRTSRSGSPLSVLFVDLDGFKNINDAHGHLCGSRALVEAARVIRTSARETDLVARFGGDEFAVVLPDTGREGAEAVGDRVRVRIAEHAFLEGEGFNIHLTASVGVATLPDVATSADGLLRAADQAMYRVKAQGKDGILIAD